MKHVISKVKINRNKSGEINQAVIELREGIKMQDPPFVLRYEAFITEDGEIFYQLYSYLSTEAAIKHAVSDYQGKFNETMKGIYLEDQFVQDVEAIQ